MRSTSLAIFLSLIMVLLMGTMNMGMAAHAVDHDHHTGTTHSTGICAWMCTAAQSVSFDSPTFMPEPILVGVFQETPSTLTTPHRTLLIPSRGPPF